MKNKKTLFKTAILCLCLCMGFILTACGSESSKKSSDGKIRLQYWHINGESQGGKTVDQFIKEFNESQDKIEVSGRFNKGYDDLLKNLQADTAAGNAPDVVQVSWSNLEYFPNNFKYTSPEEIVSKYFPEDANFLNDTFPEKILNLAKNREGKLAGIPYSVSNPVLYYNADILKKCGLSEDGPKNWNEAAQFAKKIYDQTGQYGIYFQANDTWVLQAILESGGSNMLSYDGDKPKATFASPEGIAAMQAYADLVLKDKSAVHMNNLEDALKAFYDGKIAMVASSIAKATTVKQNSNFDVRSTHFPGFEGHDLAVPAGGCYLAITSTDEEHQKAAWEFIKFLNTDDNSARWVAGTGYVPTTKGAENSQILKDYLKENPLLNAAMDQRDNAVQWTAWPGTSAPKVQQALIDMRDVIMNGSKTVNEAMQSTQEEIQKMFK